MPKQNHTKLKLLCAMAYCIALLGCRAAEKDEAEPPQPIAWTVSWTPATTRTDQQPLASQPTYELQMAEAPSGQPWEVVWTGETPVAQLQAPPGSHCFRAITIEDGVRSAPSEVICATKTESGKRIRQASAED